MAHNSRIRYNFCTSVPSTNKTFFRFLHWGYPDINETLFALRWKDVKCSLSRYKLYCHNFDNNSVVMVTPSQLDIRNFNPLYVLFLFRMYGWHSFTAKQQKYIISLCTDKNTYGTLDDIAEYLVSKFDTWDKLFLKNDVADQLIYFKYRKHLKNTKHWVSKFIHKHSIQSIPNYQLIDKDSYIEGYKAFECDPKTGLLSCRDYKFKLDKPNIISGFIQPCSRGFHFCKNKRNVWMFYHVPNKNIVLHKIRAWGVVVDEGNKTVCSHIQIMEKVDKNRFK